MDIYKKCCVGGTFDKFHDGHFALIDKAFELSSEVLIGVTSDDFASSKEHKIESYEKRCKRLNSIVAKYGKPYEIKEINDSAGTADVDSTLDAIVVSNETKKSAYDINVIRRENGLKALDIVIVEFILADDGQPISSTRIRKGEIDCEGNLL